MTRHWFGASLMLLSLGSATHAQSVLTLERTPAGYFVAPLYLGDAGPFPFLPDTAASHSAIAQPLAESLGFVSQRRDMDDVQTLTARITAERFAYGPVQLGALVQDELNMVVADATPETPLTLMGLIGADMFAGQTIELDYPNARMVLDADAPEVAHGRFHSNVNVLTAEARMRRVRTPVEILIDTGSPVTIANAYLSRRLRPDTVTVVTMLGSVSRIEAPEVDSQPVTLEAFQLGDICVSARVVESANLDVFHALGWSDRPALLIGMDVLSHTRLNIDYSSGETQIRPGDPSLECPGRRR